MRYINLRFTYLLTYLLTEARRTLTVSTAVSKMTPVSLHGRGYGHHFEHGPWTRVVCAELNAADDCLVISGVWFGSAQEIRS